MSSRTPERKIHRQSRFGCPQVRRRCQECGELMSQYKAGASALWADVRVAWRHRSLSRLERRRRLARKELLACQRAWADLVRVLPVLANPLPPPLGLSLIALAYRWPRWMLPPQFHSAEQRATFARLDAVRQAKAAFELCGSPALAEALAAGEVAARAEHFAPGGPLALENIGRRDLVRFATLASPRLPLSLCCPRAVFASLVARAAANVDDDDALLLAAGTDRDSIRRAVAALSRADLLEACVARALGGVDDDAHPGPEDRLVAWLHRRVASPFPIPVGGGGRHLPPTFLFFNGVVLFHPADGDPANATTASPPRAGPAGGGGTNGKALVDDSLV